MIKIVKEQNDVVKAGDKRLGEGASFSGVIGNTNSTFVVCYGNIIVDLANPSNIWEADNPHLTISRFKLVDLEIKVLPRPA